MSISTNVWWSNMAASHKCVFINLEFIFVYLRIQYSFIFYEITSKNNLLYPFKAQHEE